MRFAPGTRLGPYAIVTLIGEGGMGEVYRAADARRGREVAIKILADRFVANRHAASLFERDARAASALSHPNIVSIYDFDVAGEVPFVVSELLEGQTLRQRMASPLPWQKAAEIGAAIAEGLSAAHALGIVHGDLKPENVFLTSDGRVKILDFGIAHMKEGAGEGGRVPSDNEPTAQYRAAAPPGTLGYVSPEQIRAEEPGPPSDLFSLGVILHEMIAGRNPFARATAMETLAAILHDDPPPVLRDVPGVSARIDRLIQDSLEKSPPKRLQSASDLAYQLREALREADLAAVSPRSRPRRVLVGAAAAIVLISVAGFLLLSRSRGFPLAGVARAPLTSVAILPFTNGTAEPQLEFLSDGLTEALIDRLAEIDDLRVIARPAAFRYKGSKVGPVEIGRELSVSAIVAGRMDIEGERILLHVDVTDVGGGAKVWGHSFERPRDELPAVPGDIARALAKELRLGLAHPERERVARAASASSPAFEHYLKGLEALHAQTREGREGAIVHFQKAVEADPRFARAHAALGQTYLRHGVEADPQAMKAKARAAIARSLEIDPVLAEGHLALGQLRFWDEWDFDAAEAEFRRAIELNRSLAPAYGQYAVLLMYRGWFDASVEQARRALEIDPTLRSSRIVLAGALLHSGRHEEAAAELSRLLSADPDFPAAHSMLARVYDARGDEASACRELVLSRELEGSLAPEIERLSAACASGGPGAYRRELIAILRTGDVAVDPFDIASAYAALGENENAYAYLERAFEEHSNGFLAIGIEPELDELRGDPRVKSLLRRAGVLGKIGTQAGPLQARALPGERETRTGPAASPDGD